MGSLVFFRKKERWTATWLGNMLKLVILVLIAFIFFKTIHPFLSENNPIETKVMVVEGFIPDYAIEEAMDLFTKDNYDLMIITGKKRMKGAHLDMYENDGEFSAATLTKLGFDMQKVVVVPVNYTVTKDRTYESGKAIKNYIQINPDINSFNLVTIGAHARRSRYLFAQSFNPDFNIGIVSVTSRGYDSVTWWQTSVGFRQVMQETIAWVYARFFFFP